MHGSMGIFARGAQVQLPENSSENVFLCCCLFSPQLISQFYRGFPIVISKKSIISQGLRGVQHFPGRSKFFQGGQKANFYRNP